MHCHLDCNYPFIFFYVTVLFVMGSFTSNYAIKDDISLDEYKVRVIKPEQNTVLIDTETIYWEPSFKDVGLNNFTIQVFDGLAVNQSSFSVFVDTTINILAARRLLSDARQPLALGLGQHAVTNNANLSR